MAEGSPQHEEMYYYRVKALESLRITVLHKGQCWGLQVQLFLRNGLMNMNSQSAITDEVVLK